MKGAACPVLCGVPRYQSASAIKGDVSGFMEKLVRERVLLSRTRSRTAQDTSEMGRRVVCVRIEPDPRAFWVLAVLEFMRAASDALLVLNWPLGWQIQPTMGYAIEDTTGGHPDDTESCWQAI